MRTSFFLFFTLATLAIGCGPGPDPSLGDCSARKAGAVVIGTGESDFTPLSGAGVPITDGSQGGQHIWLGLSCQNLGPRVTAHFKITDVETGIEISQHGLAVAVDLEYDGKGSDLGHGIFGYLRLDEILSGSGVGGGSSHGLPHDISGRKIKIEAEVADDCKKPAIHAEVTTTISSG